MGDVERDQIVAFRLASHNLTRRLGAGLITSAAEPCGIQETPTGSAASAFAARVEGLSLVDLEHAKVEDRSVVTLWSVRGAPFVVPASDFTTFSVGALPVDSASFEQSLGGWAGALRDADVDINETLDQMIAIATELLDGRALNVNELRDQIYIRVPSLAAVVRPTGAHADMPEPLFRAISTSGAMCIIAGRGTNAELARTDQWLRSPPVEPDRTAARADLARRFLHCYGPATPERFADWSQRGRHDARSSFALVDDEVVEVSVNARPAWILADDQDDLASPPEPRGVRLLPVQDPFLQQRDRSILVSEEAFRRKLWRPVGGPGAVLVDGQVAGIWRSRIKRNRLDVTVEPFGRLRIGARDAIAAEAESIAPFRNCESAEVTYTV